MRICSTISSRGIAHTLAGNKPLPSLVPFVFVLIIILLMTPRSFILAQDRKTVDTTEKNLSGYRGKINRLQQGIVQQETKITKNQTAERNILDELEVLDTKLVTQQQKLEALETKLQKQQAMIDRDENALGKIRSDKVRVEDHLQKRITAYYTMGDIGILNATFSTKTLPDLLTFHDAFEVLMKYDKDVIKIYQNTIDELVRGNVALELEKSVLEDFFNQRVQEKELLKKTQSEKKALLTHVRTQEQLYQRAIVEMQKASEELAESIVSMKNKGQIYKKQGFLAKKGRLPPPIDGILKTLFHQEKTNKLGISRYSEGIELQAPDGSKIESVAEGDVIFSGYLRGYGNTVIIHHGFQYYTVTSRIEKILVEKGQKVEQGDTIGVMGDTATLFDEGLYFEIRHGRESLDPLLWLNPNRLSNLHDHQIDKVGLEQSVH